MHNDFNDFIKQLTPSDHQIKAEASCAVLTVLSDKGIVEISGIDAKKFLQGQLTCNVNTMPSDHAQLGAHCSQQGRIISMFWLVEHKGNLYLSMPRAIVSIAIAALKKYSIFFKVDITDVSDKFITLGISGVMPDSHPSHPELISVKLPSLINRSLLIGHSHHLLNQLTSLQNHLRTTTNHAWKTQDIIDGIPSLYPETSGIFLPHELNLDTLNAISFDKGCYTGQEIIARMHYRGKLKFRMHKAKINSALPILPGSDIFIIDSQQPHAAGKIVDACQEENNWYNVLMTLEESCIGNKRIFPSNNDQTYFIFS